MTVTLNNRQAILICGHGSRSPDGTAEFYDLVRNLQSKLPDQAVFGAFLEFNQPDILTSLQNIYDQGFREIFAQPLTLYNAGHTKGDIPALLAEFKASNPDVVIQYGTSLGLSSFIIEAAAQSIKSVLPDGDPEDCKLLVVGRGSKDRDVADQTISLCQKLHDNLDLGDSRYCYAFETAPLLNSALKQAAHSHYPHVVVLPFLLFSGRLLSDIYTEVDRAREKYSGFSFYKAPPLGQQDHLIEAILHNIKNDPT